MVIPPCLGGRHSTGLGVGVRTKLKSLTIVDLIELNYLTE